MATPSRHCAVSSTGQPCGEPNCFPLSYTQYKFFKYNYLKLPRIFTPFADSRRLAHFPETLQGKRLGSRAGWPNCNSPTILSSQHLSVTSRPCTPPQTHRPLGPLGPLGSDLRYSSSSCNSLKKVMSGSVYLCIPSFCTMKSSKTKLQCSIKMCYIQYSFNFNFLHASYLMTCFFF